MRTTRSHIAAYAARAGIVLLVSTSVSFAIPAIGFRLLYDSVLPEVAGLVVTGLVLAYMRPRFAWLALIGIGLGILLSERGLPVTPSAEHIARYGPPQNASVVDVLKICGFPAVGAIAGIAARLIRDPSLPTRSNRVDFIAPRCP